MIEVFVAIADNDAKDSRASLLAFSVKKSSLDTYHSEVKRLISWARLCRLVELRKRADQNFKPSAGSLADFQLFAGSGIKEKDFITLAHEFKRADFYSYCAGHSTVHTVQYSRSRASLRLAQMMAGVDVWASEEEFKTMEKGAYNCAAARGLISKRPRGTLSEEMFTNLITWVRERNSFMADAMIIQAGACLRISELTSLSPAQITKDGIWLINQKRDSVAKMTSPKPKTTFKRLTLWDGGIEALRWLHKLVQDNPGHKVLFPRQLFTHKDYNATIRAGAQALNFPSDLLFDGSHVLRHTGVGLAVKQLLNSRNLEDIGDILLMSASMVVHYSQSVEDRLGKVHIPSFMLKHIHNPENIQERDDSDDSEEETDEGVNPIKRAKKTQAKKRSRSESTPPDTEVPKGLSHLSVEERTALRDRMGELRRLKAQEDYDNRRKRREEKANKALTETVAPKA